VLGQAIANTDRVDVVKGRSDMSRGASKTVGGTTPPTLMLTRVATTEMAETGAASLPLVALGSTLVLTGWLLQLHAGGRRCGKRSR